VNHIIVIFLKQTNIVLISALLLTIFPPQAVAAAEEIALNPGESCITSTCHADKAKKQYVHTIAANGGNCIICHRAPDLSRHQFKIWLEGGELCAQCHGVKADKKFKHEPVAVGLCTFCHDPHQSDNPRQLKFPPDSRLCFNCHEKNKFEGKVVHGPVTEGQCLDCHDPHTSDHDFQLKAALPDLCFGCHDKNLKDPKGKGLPAPKRTFDDKELSQHLPFAIGQCIICHLPHTGPNYRLLRGAYPESFYTKYSEDKYICLTCHNKKAFNEPRTLTETAFRNGNLNLHYRHVNRDKGRTCRACHHHHGAKNPKLIREAVPFGSRIISIKDFELTETGGQCGPTCHPKVRYDRYEPVQNTLKVTVREGADAAPEMLQRAKEQQLIPELPDDEFSYAFNSNIRRYNHEIDELYGIDSHGIASVRLCRGTAEDRDRILPAAAGDAAHPVSDQHQR
jgi:predicted CXXCH cytochrome family protein